MTLQIEDPDFLTKVENLAKLMGVTEIAAMEQAIDDKLDEQEQISANKDSWVQIRKLLHQMDQLPRNPNFVDPLQWDENGLPI